VGPANWTRRTELGSTDISPFTRGVTAHVIMAGADDQELLAAATKAAATGPTPRNDYPEGTLEHDILFNTALKRQHSYEQHGATGRVPRAKAA